MGCRFGWRARAAVIAGSALAGWACSPLAEAQAPAGTWEFSVNSEAAKCRIRPELAAPGRHLVTIRLESWSVPGGDRLAFASRSGQAVLDFRVRLGGAFLANSPNGEIYRLAATAINGGAEESLSHTEQRNEAQPQIVTAQASTGKVQAEAAGRYSLLREGDKDTGCMLTLDVKVTSWRRGKASLAPGCRDQGLVIFDPAGWEIIDGRLVLSARKGQKAHFDARPDGSWKKDPAEGKTLSLKKL
jgi:hypothetical protein